MLNLTLAVLVVTATTLCGIVAYQLREDRPVPQARHRMTAKPAAAPQPPEATPAPQEPKRFDPLDTATPLDDVEQFLQELGVRWQPLALDVAPVSAPPAVAAEDTRELEVIQ